MRPSKKEIKKYFENAKEVECLYDKEPHDISNQIMDISRFEKEWWLDTSEDRKVNIQLWAPNEGYAKILTYKNNDMKISKEFIKANADKTLKEVFPEVCGPVLEVGKWYSHKEGNCLAFVEKIIGTDFVGYGFGNTNNWKNSTDNWTCNFKGWTEATESEIFEALKNEAVKRGYREGVWINRSSMHANTDTIKIPVGEHSFFDFEFNILYLNEREIFSKGVWAEIIKIDYNEPILSLNDLLSVWGNTSEIELYKMSPLFKNFERLAEEKLNKP